MGLFDVFDSIFDWVDSNVGQPLNNFVQSYENYIPTVAGWATGMPWLGSAWNYANMDDAQQRAGLGSMALKAAAGTAARDFMDLSSADFGGGTGGVMDVGGVPINPTDWFKAYTDLSPTETTSGSVLNSMFGTPEITGVKDWTGYDTTLKTFGQKLDAPVPTSLDTVFQNVSPGVGAGSTFNTDPSVGSLTRGFSPTMDSSVSSLAGQTNPDDLNVFDNVGSNMDSSFFDTQQPQNTLENVTQGSMSLPDGGGMSTSPVLDQPQFSTTPIAESSTMDTLKDYWKTVNSPIGGVQGAPTWLKAGMGLGKIYGGLQTDQKNREAQQMMKDMYESSMRTSDPFASDRALASTKWQAMVNNPAAGWEDYAAGIQPELQAASAKLAAGGRRNMLPTLLTQAKQKYMGDAKNRLSAYNPAQFPGGNASQVNASFAPQMAALKMKEGAGLPTALANIGQEAINPRTLADLFSRFTKPDINIDYDFASNV